MEDQSAKEIGSEVLNKKIRDITGDTVILMFSRGKDSIVAFYELKKYWGNIILIHQYLHPNLCFVNDSLKYFEDKFQTKIYNIPHCSLYRMVNENVFQSPQTSDNIEFLGLPNHTYKEYYDSLREDFNCPNAFVATGVRVNDSPLRRLALKNCGYIAKDKREFYPVYDWTNDDIRNCFKENNIEIPIDYKLFGRSFDGVNYKYIKALKENIPNDYKKLKELYPLIGLEILRYETI